MASLREKLAERAGPYLQPGEQIQQVYMAQGGPSPYSVVSDVPAADGPGLAGAMHQLLGLDRVQDPEPASDGAVEAAASQAQANVVAAR